LTLFTEVRGRGFCEVRRYGVLGSSAKRGLRKWVPRNRLSGVY
jgi:hypothetical protein